MAEKERTFNAIVWDREKAQKKAKEFIDHFNKHVGNNTKRWRENEAVFRSDFYKQWSGSTLKISDVLNQVDDRFKDWVVKASANHVFTFVRLLHSMLMSNESIVTASPATSDAQAKEAAVAADRLIRYSRRKYEVREYVDLFVLHTLIYGLGCFKVNWNPLLGELRNKDEEESWKNLVFSGDAECRVVSPFDYCLFSTSNHLKKTYGYMEKLYFDKDEIEAMYPQFASKFTEEKDVYVYDGINNTNEKLQNRVVAYEYWEIGRPFNANAGRYMLFLEDGTVLELKNNPMKDKSLPVALFSDVILPNSLYPISVVDMLREPQGNINDLMSRILENVKLYARVFLLIDRNAALNKDALDDSPVIPMEYNGSEGRPPEPMKVPSLPSFIFKCYDMLVEIMQHIAGIRDFSRGTMPQRVSGFAANLMVEADNRVHTQVHERFKTSIKDIYKKFLVILHDKLDDEVTIDIVGDENEVESMSFKKSVLDAGYTINVDYGTSMPIDPAAKRQMIQELVGMAASLGVPLDGYKVMELLKLSDVMGTYDINRAARKRQKEEIKNMIESLEFNNIDYEAEDHLAHYTELFDYFQESEYGTLDESIKEMLKQHADLHTKAHIARQQGITEEEFKQGIFARPVQQQPEGEITPQ